MNTSLIESTREAADIIRGGGLVAFPTETVFGLGVDATNDEAIRKLFEAKGRPSSNPLIVHVADASRWSDAAATLTPSAELLLSKFAPGPLTVVLPKRAEVSSLVTAGLDTVGVRVPDHPIAVEILRLAGCPVAAPSANRSGRPSGTRWRTVLEDLDGRIDAVFRLDGPPHDEVLLGNASTQDLSLGLESTVVDCTGPIATVLRPGAVTLEQIRSVLPDARELNSEMVRDAAQNVRSPGTLHPHYQPQAKIQLIETPEEITMVVGEAVAYCGLIAWDKQELPALAASFQTVEEYATSFYEFLREADRRGVTMIYVQLAPDEGIGHALRDRQLRAAGVK